MKKAYYHLPGLFEFYEFYREFLKLYKEHREYFYDWCEIGSIYGSPAGCLWGGGRVELGFDSPDEVFAMLRDYGISARLTYSNSLVEEEHLRDKECNDLCKKLVRYGQESEFSVQNGVIVHSDLLLEYLRKHFPDLYFVSSTTKVITDFNKLKEELEREEFQYVVPDFRLNKRIEDWKGLSQELKDKVEFLCNECCWFGCTDRAECYRDVSRKNLGLTGPDHICTSPGASEGYSFAKAMDNPGFISLEDIENVYLPMGFSNFKIEGRGLGSALVLEFILYYMTKPRYQIHVREALYLDNTLDLF